MTIVAVGGVCCSQRRQGSFVLGWPDGSFAFTQNTWTPSARPSITRGVVQAPNPAPSSAHSNDGDWSSSLVANVKRWRRSAATATPPSGGPASVVTVGTCVSLKCATTSNGPRWRSVHTFSGPPVQLRSLTTTKQLGAGGWFSLTLLQRLPVQPMNFHPAGVPAVSVTEQFPGRPPGGGQFPTLPAPNPAQSTRVCCGVEAGVVHVGPPPPAVMVPLPSVPQVTVSVWAWAVAGRIARRSSALIRTFMPRRYEPAGPPTIGREPRTWAAGPWVYVSSGQWP